MFELNDVKLENETYSIKAYITNNKIEMKIESGSNKYLGRYDLEFLKTFTYFQKSKDLDGAIASFKNLFDLTDYSIIKDGNNIQLFFPIRIGDIRLFLKNIEEMRNISYENLSDKMKDIIDKDELVLGIDLGTTSSCASVMIDD